ncbi:MAG: hypothetical protein AB7P56_05340 [Nitrososphaeraceae archaeon]
MNTKNILEDDKIKIDWKTETIVIKESGWNISVLTDKKMKYNNLTMMILNVYVVNLKLKYQKISYLLKFLMLYLGKIKVM